LRHGAQGQPQIHLDLRYVGQEFTLQVPVTLEAITAGDRAGIRAAFDALYELRYAHHSPEEPVEMVNIRLALIGKRPRPSFPRLAEGGLAEPSHERAVHFADEALRCPVYPRETLGAGSKIVGPALIQEHGTTTVLFAQDSLTVASSGELLIAVGA